MTAAPVTGLRLWLIVAAPLLAQFAVVGVGAGILRAFGLIGAGETTLANLPQALLLLSAFGVFLLTIWWAARALGAPRPTLALRRTPLGRGIALAAIGVVAGTLAAVALEPIFHGQESQGVEAGDVTSFATGLGLVLSIFTIIVGAAVCEELYFRGLLYGRLDERFGIASAVVGSAGIFGLAHIEPNAFPALFALGLILGVIRWRSNSIWPCVGVHAANNTLASIAILLAIK